MKQENNQGQAILFVMEPEEELASLRFIESYKPPKLVITRALWYPDLTESETAKELGLTGGYGLSFFNLTGGSFC